jgi:hypothetical protein
MLPGHQDTGKRWRADLIGETVQQTALSGVGAA